ncbi:MAG: DJ-1/PfpI family protein [Bacteroidota bacterium]
MMTRTILLFCLLVVSPYLLQAQTVKKKVAIYLQDNVEILDFAGPMEVFLVAGFEVYTVATTSAPLKAMHTLAITPDYSLADAPAPDILVFVGGGDVAAAKNPQVKAWAQQMAATAELQFSVCTGAYFLAEAGLLDQRVATTYHLSIPQLASAYPQIDVRENVRFVDNGEVVTTAGISAGIDGALHVVAKLKGTRYARWVAEAMEYDKWIPEEGLILTKGLAEEVAIHGFAETITNNPTVDLYPGELLNLADTLTQNGQLAAAEACVRLALRKGAAPDLPTYDYLRRVYAKQGKTVPPTTAEFLAVFKKEGAEAAKQLHRRVAEQFPGWVYLDTDQVIRSAYLDYYTQDDLATAKAMIGLLYGLFPTDPYVTFVVGLYEERSDNLEAAKAYYQKSLQLDANFHMAQEKLTELLAEE